jgi:hypothetical protein
MMGCAFCYSPRMDKITKSVARMKEDECGLC